MAIPDGKEVYSTSGPYVLSSSSNRVNLERLAPCSHEEADTRLLIHALDAQRCGHQRIKIRSNDTDVIVLAVSAFNTIRAERLWVAYGTGKTFKYLPIHVIAQSLSEEEAKALPLFHALTGCDTVSFFCGRGKRTTWEVWSVFPELTQKMSTNRPSTTDIDDAFMSTIERFVVLCYDRTSTLTSVNKLRQELFAKKSKVLDIIPPTQAALLQHVKRAVYQGIHVWGQTLVLQPILPCPSNWGWKRDNQSWIPYWTALPQAKDICYELIRCGCKLGCGGRCKCKKANLVCTGLCNCGAGCESSD